MKKIYVSIIMILILTISNQNLSSTEPDGFMGDFCIVGAAGFNITATIEIASVPFEGITQPKDSFNVPINRVLEIQNGIYWRFFMPGQSTIQNNMAYMTKTMNADGNIFDIGHCSGGEFPLPNDNLSWGFAKYKITISVAGTKEKYQFYINSLDSKYGRNFTGGYSRDLYVEYLPSMPVNRRVVFSKKHDNFPIIAIDTIATWDTLANGKPSKEYKLWKVILDQDYPMEKNFYARTTPFPISPRAIYDNHIRELELGTKVIFDTVYNYTGLSDKYGYNTIDSAQIFHPYFTNPPIPSGNSQKNTFVTPAYFYFDENSELVMGMKINVLPGDTIILKPDKRLWISGYDQNSDNGDTLVLSAGSVFIKETAAQLNTCYGGTILDYGAAMNWSPNAFSHIYQRSELSYLGTSHTINNSGHVEIDGYGRLKVGNNTTVTFDGAGTYLKLNPNSIVQLGENAKIEFKNGAYLVANGSNISSINSSTPGKGLYFENTALDTISGCTFTNLKNSIYINGISGFFGNITNNTFNQNVDMSYSYVIECKNVNNINITDNHINMRPGKGIGILFRFPYSSGSSAASTTNTNINIINNHISDGAISAAFVCLTNSYEEINFIHNDCSGSVLTSNINTRHITGNIKDNTISSYSAKSLELNQSNPYVLNNSFSTSNINIYNYDSYPILSPGSAGGTDGGWVWSGGKNRITSSSSDNIYYSGGKVWLDWGQNCFTKSINNFHLFGDIVEPSLSYLVRNNSFNYVSSVSQLYDLDSGLIVNTVLSEPNFSCSNSSDAGVIWMIKDLGNGVYDTIYKTSNNSGTQPSQDEAFYNTANQKMAMDDYFDAISYFKSLITGFPESSYTDACLYSLYECYQKMDIVDERTVRDILYTDLKNYLDGKILSGLYSEEFNNSAYNITLMCLASISEYNEAMEGFEFIALYHPDAYTRLLASWDYAEVQELLNGSGGISSKEENLTDAEYFAKITKRVNKGIKEDPIKKKVKKSFDKVKTDKTSKTEKEVLAKTNALKSAKLEVSKLKQKDEVMNTKVTSIMRYSKILKKEDREKLQIDDILFYNKTENKDDIKVNTNVPVVYSLSQNYPNPFNPTTKINYALPKTGLVTMKIYDVTGREIQTLVNDVKQAGNYTVDFNGSMLSSGVYFYKIQSGDFVSVKRMVLIK